MPAIDSSAVPAAAPSAGRLDSTVTMPGQFSQMAETAKPAVPSNLGFDLDLGTPAAAATSLDFDVGAPAASAASHALDVELSLPEVGGGEKKSTVERAAAAPNAGLDFEFDLDAPAATSAAAIKEPAVDFSGINLDLTTQSAAAEMPESAGDEGDAADVNTKLELAQAYEEMGDREGARELLEEVIQEGSAHQQELARAKLATLGA
jgi:pilus assembly protein FimV